jgi:hypothetical protein
MNAGWVIDQEERRLAKIEGIFAERRCPDRDPGRERVHHSMVFTNDVRSLFSMRHSERPPANGVPVV